MTSEPTELACRHCGVIWKWEWEYCPECRRNFGGAIWPEQQTAEELAEIDRLIAVIASAFSGVERGDGTSLHEAWQEYAVDEDHRRDLRSRDTENRWQDVPDSKIEMMSCMSFFDPVGWRFYLPAFMIWTLKNWRTTDLIIADSVVWTFGVNPSNPDSATSRFSLLNAEQSRAVYEFLRFFCEYEPECDAREAIDLYWGRFAH